MKSIIQESSSVAKAIEQAWTAAGKPQEFTVKVFEEAQRNFFGLTTKSAKIALLFGAPIQKERDARSQSFDSRRRTSDSSAYAQKREERRPAAPQQRRPMYEATEKRDTRASEQQRAESPYSSPQTRQATSDRPQRPERIERTEHRPSDVTHSSAQRSRQQLPHHAMNDRAEMNQEQMGEATPETNVTPKPPREIWTAGLVEAASAWVRGVLDEMEKQNAQFTTQTNNYYLRVTIDTQLAATPEQERTILRNMSFLLLQALKKQFKRPLHGFKIVLVRE
ncbi:MAG: hypothetical protein WCE21_01645 [Candidatus Babeliales bacterium]